MKSKLLLLGIILLGFVLRFTDVNWDQNQHLHPDERFLTMVTTSMTLPRSFKDYLNAQISTFNPANIGYPFYVYGTFPVVLNKLMALQNDTDNYNDSVIQGRMLSAFFDLLVIFFLFKTLELLERKEKLHFSIKYWGAFFYTISVLPIQLSHFFAVDTFLNFFMFSSFYFALRFYYDRHLGTLLTSAVLFGLAIGSKISAIYILPLLIFLIISSIVPKHYFRLFTYLAVYFLTIYIIGRIADPYLFQNGTDFFDPHISELFLQNIHSLKAWSTDEAWFPPSVQWVNKLPVLFPLINIAVFGIGITLSILVVIGCYSIVRKYKMKIFAVMLLWVILFFLYQGSQFSTTMRYFLPIYPFLTLFAAIGFYTLIHKFSKVAVVGVLSLVILWPMFFFSIYTKDHSRNQASVWIYENIPNGSVLLSEHWDDALPLSINPPSSKRYVQEQLPVFDPDSTEKWDKINTLLQKGDYYIISSNRGWGSIPTFPKRYPQMTEFYKDLFDDKTAYKKVAEFTSYPTLSYLGIPITIPDDWSEEAFTVYDHPKVMIFQKTR